MAHITDNTGRIASEVGHRVLDIYDATPLVGLRVNVTNTAIEWTDSDGDVSIEVPRLDELCAAAAVARCLIPIKLRGWELRALRKIMGLTLADMAGKLDSKTAVETVSRWESEKQPIGGYVEKIIKLVVCEALHKEAPGVKYHAWMIADLKVLDPWLVNNSYEVPHQVFYSVKMKEKSGGIVDIWDAKLAA